MPMNSALLHGRHLYGIPVITRIVTWVDDGFGNLIPVTSVPDSTYWEHREYNDTILIKFEVNRPNFIGVPGK